MVPRPKVAPSIPKYAGRSVGVVKIDNSMITPRYMPAPARPARARPMMRAFMEGAAPQTAEPTSKPVTQAIYSHLGLNWPYIFAQKFMVPAAARSKVTDTHGSLPTDPKCWTMAGMMSATMVWSREKKNTLERMAETGSDNVSKNQGISCCITAQRPSPAVYGSYRLGTVSYHRRSVGGFDISRIGVVVP